jgi:hypothetical protein
MDLVLQGLIRVSMAVAISLHCWAVQDAASSSPDATPSGSAEKQAAANKPSTSQKYREAFFPNGMPMEEDPDSGQKKQSVYAFYDEARLDDSSIAVLYSKKLPSGRADADYTVFIGILAKAAEAWKPVASLDVTESMPVETEGPGNFYEMDGRIDTFSIGAGATGLHVNLWATLAGTGAINGASDLFYRIGAEHKLELLLTLNKTSEFSRLGASASTTVDSRILVGDVNGDGKAEIVVEKSQLTVENRARKEQTEKPVVYELVENKFAMKGTIDPGMVASHAQALKAVSRSRFIRRVAAKQTGTGNK